MSGGLLGVVGITCAAYSYHSYLERELKHRAQIIRQGQLSQANLESALRNCSKHWRTNQISHFRQVVELKAANETTRQQLEMLKMEFSLASLQLEEQYQLVRTLQEEKFRNATVMQRRRTEFAHRVRELTTKLSQHKSRIKTQKKVRVILQERVISYCEKNKRLEETISEKQNSIQKYVDKIARLQSFQTSEQVSSQLEGLEEGTSAVNPETMLCGGLEGGRYNRPHRISNTTRETEFEDIEQATNDDDDTFLLLYEAMDSKNELIDSQIDCIRELCREIEQRRCRAMGLESTISELRKEISKHETLMDRLEEEHRATRLKLNKFLLTPATP